MWLPLSSVFVFFYSHVISAILAFSHSAACLGFVLLPHGVKSVGSWACTTSFYSFIGLGIVLAEAPARPTYYSFSCHAYGLVGCHSYHVGPLNLLPLPLGFHKPFTLLLPLIMPLGLLAVIPVMLAHWIYFLFSWASMAHLLCFCHLLCPWAC